MKRIAQFIAVACIMCTMSVPAFAVETAAFQLDELNLTVTLPADYVVFTRDIKENDPNLDAYGLSKEAMDSLMESRYIYLNAWDPEVHFEITVTMIESTIHDFNEIRDADLLSLASSLDEGGDVTYSGSDLYQHDQAKFLKLYFDQPNNGSTVYSAQYYTVYANQAISFTMHSYSGAIDSAKDTILKSIVDSAHFGPEPSTAQIPAKTEPFTYTDKYGTATFTIPDNWTESPMNEPRAYIDVKFTSNLDPGACILFSCSDLYEIELTDAERESVARGDVDNSIFTKVDVADMLGAHESDISTAVYNGKEYFYAEIETIGTAHGISAAVPITYLMHCENGYLYIFQFSGYSNNAHFKDFEALLNSVQYLAAETPNFGVDSPGLRSSWWAAFVRGLLTTVVIHVLPIVVYRYGIRRSPVSPKKAKIITVVDSIVVFFIMVFLSSLDENRVSSAAILLWSFVNYRILTCGQLQPGRLLLCPSCGNRLGPDSKFCNRCGAVVAPTQEEEPYGEGR